MRDESRERVLTPRRWWIEYFADARRPIHVLLMLAPLVVAVEFVGLLAQPVAPPFHAPVARQLIETLLSISGAAGTWLPPAVLLGTLLWMSLRSKSRTVRPATTVVMFGEALVAAIPLMVLARVLGPLAVIDGWPIVRLCEGISAGLYEELVFRMFLVSALLLAADTLAPRAPAGFVRIGAILISGVAFSWVHYPPIGGEPFAWASFLSRSIAGCYLGFVFVHRGMGIAAGAHAAYNAITILASHTAVPNA